MFFNSFLSKLFLKQRKDGSTTVNILNIIVVVVLLIIILLLAYRSFTKVMSMLGFESSEVKLERTKHNLETQQEVADQYKKNLIFIKKKSEIEYNISKSTLKKADKIDKNINDIKTKKVKINKVVVKTIIKETDKKHNTNKLHTYKIGNNNHKQQTNKLVIKVDKVKYVKEGYSDYIKILKARKLIMSISQAKDE